MPKNKSMRRQMQRQIRKARQRLVEVRDQPGLLVLVDEDKQIFQQIVAKIRREAVETVPDQMLKSVHRHEKAPRMINVVAQRNRIKKSILRIPPLRKGLARLRAKVVARLRRIKISRPLAKKLQATGIRLCHRNRGKNRTFSEDDKKKVRDLNHRRAEFTVRFEIIVPPMGGDV
jgi:hypothetical protein